jgi:hypothetical protein
MTLFPITALTSPRAIQTCSTARASFQLLAWLGIPGFALFTKSTYARGVASEVLLLLLVAVFEHGKFVVYDIHRAGNF